MYADTAFQLFNKGFNHLKIVGRGRAVPLTKDLVDYMREKSSTFFYFQVRFTTAFNKIGEVVDEVHVMISKKSA